AITVGRTRYPSFELYVQAAESADILTERRDRSQYPAYFKDASPFEIFKVFRGTAANMAQMFLQLIINPDYMRVRPEVEERMKQEGFTKFQNPIDVRIRENSIREEVLQNLEVEEQLI